MSPDIATPDATDIAEHLDTCDVDKCPDCKDRGWCQTCEADTIPIRGECRECGQPLVRTTAPDRIQER